MELVKRLNVSDGSNSRTVYTVRLDDDRTVDVIRRHFPDFWNKPLIYIAKHHDKDVDAYKIIEFVKNNGPKNDFVVPRLICQHKNAFSPTNDACYSLEQAKYLADKKWEESHHKEDWLRFEIRIGDDVYADYTAKEAMDKED